MRTNLVSAYTSKTPRCCASREQTPTHCFCRFGRSTQLHPTQQSICSQGTSSNHRFYSVFTCASAWQKRFGSVREWFGQCSSVYRRFPFSRGLCGSISTSSRLFVKRVRARWDTWCASFAEDNPDSSSEPCEYRSENWIRSFFRDMIWLRATHAECQVSDLLDNMIVTERWNHAVKTVQRAWDVQYFRKHYVCIKNDGFTILENFAEHDIPTLDATPATACPLSFPSQTLLYLHTAVERSITASKQTLRILIISFENRDVDTDIATTGRARFTSTDKLRINVFQQNCQKVRIVKRRACVSFWHVWLSAWLDLDERNSYQTAVLVTGRRYPLKEERCKAWAAHNNVAINQVCSPGIFFIVNWGPAGK